MPPTPDISIGQDEWIRWVDLDFAQEQFSIDFWLEPTAQFWEKLETLCVAGCCGIHAFPLWPDDVKRAAAEFGTEELRSHLLKLREAVTGAKSQLITSQRLNNLFDKGVFLRLMDHLLACLPD